MTPKDIIEEILRENRNVVDKHWAAEWIGPISRKVLEGVLQRVIDRSLTPVSNEKIAKMANILQENEKSNTAARENLESLYYKKENKENEKPGKTSSKNV